MNSQRIMKNSIRNQIYVVALTVIVAISMQSCGGGGRALSGAADTLDLPGGSDFSNEVDYPVSTTLYRIESCESTPVCYGPDDESKVTASGDTRLKSCDWDCATKYKEFSNRAVSVRFLKYQRKSFNGYEWEERGNCWGVVSDHVSESCY